MLGGMKGKIFLKSITFYINMYRNFYTIFEFLIFYHSNHIPYNVLYFKHILTKINAFSKKKFVFQKLHSPITKKLLVIEA